VNCSRRAVVHLPSDTAFGVSVFTPKQNKFYMELRSSTSYERCFFRVIGFHPEAIKFYIEPRLSKSYEKFSFGLLVLTPKQPWLYMEMTMSWSYEILFGFRYWLAGCRSIILFGLHVTAQVAEGVRFFNETETRCKPLVWYKQGP